MKNFITIQLTKILKYVTILLRTELYISNPDKKTLPGSDDKRLQKERRQVFSTLLVTLFYRFSLNLFLQSGRCCFSARPSGGIQSMNNYNMSPALSGTKKGGRLDFIFTVTASTPL